MVEPIKVLFVCMGNICRSPTAEGVFRRVVEEQNLQQRIKIDSAGTHAYHIGDAPDPRSQSTARKQGVDLSTQRARKATGEDFAEFDYIVAMDRSNYENLKVLSSDDTRLNNKAKLVLFMQFSNDWSEEEVPDPYYGKGDGFEVVFKMIRNASEGLLEHIVNNDF